MLICCLSVAMPYNILAQDVTMGIRVGGMAYNGELNEGTIASTFRIVNPSVGVMADYELFYPLILELSGTFGHLSGDDDLSTREWMNRRNLSFRTVIWDLSLSAKWMLFRQFDKESNFDIFPKAGASVFYFNPEAFYRGEWYELQPLGTEGQGNPGYPDRYSNFSIAFSLGGGVEYKLNELITLGLDFVIAFTRTDYIDDISRDYVNYDELLELNGPLAAALSNRTGEYLGTEPVRVPTGTKRGNPGDKDHIARGAFYFRYNISYVSQHGNISVHF
jgi:hypothetical protein